MYYVFEFFTKYFFRLAFSRLNVLLKIFWLFYSGIYFFLFIYDTILFINKKSFDI